MNLHERLKEERERLGFSQTAFAALAGASKHSQINWEKGVASPNASALAAWVLAGLDVLYVVTGQRAPVTPDSLKMAPDEKIMLDNYRHAPDGVKSGVKTTLGAFAPGASEGSKRKAS